MTSLYAVLFTKFANDLDNPSKSLYTRECCDKLIIANPFPVSELGGVVSIPDPDELFAIGIPTTTTAVVAVVAVVVGLVFVSVAILVV